MWVQIRTVDGKKSIQIDKLSKLTTIEDLKKRIEEHFNVTSSKQRLFFSGKQLEDGHSLFDYKVGLNAIIQVMFKANLDDYCYDNNDNKVNNTNIDESENKDENKDEQDINEIKPSDDQSVEINSLYKKGDKVDAMDVSMGAWFEAIVVKITCEKMNIFYHVYFEDYDESEVFKVTEKEVRPRARKQLCWNEIEKGTKVMANYNTDDPKERGFWYDVVVTRKVEKRKEKLLYGKLMLGKDGTVSEECRIMFTDEVFKIEENGKVAPHCSHCKDDSSKLCKECSCHICGGKHEPENQIICDECDMAYHLSCMDPPLEKLPEEDEWYCSLCRNDPTEIVRIGEKLKVSKKKQKMASSQGNTNRDWGKGMACVGRTKVCTLVPSNHFGPIPGVPVGSTWKFRLQASEAGVHRPHVSGIHGRENEGAYSIVLAGGYEDDHDDGDEFYYTGSGGRDLSGNRRTAEQSSDQKLAKMNKALAKNCNANIDDKNGAESTDWKEGKPVRVMRSAKFKKHSKFAPEEGVRYDGIYKIVKYWPEKGKSGFLVWRYFLRRDDPTPSPWSKKGKKLTEELGLSIQYPEGYLEAQAKKGMENSKATPSKENQKSKRKRPADLDENLSANSKKKKEPYSLPEDIKSAIKLDEDNTKLWQDIMVEAISFKGFLEAVTDRFMCLCCQEIVFKPITTKCGHNTCQACLTRSFKAGVISCPACRSDVDKNITSRVRIDKNEDDPNGFSVSFVYNNDIFSGSGTSKKKAKVEAAKQCLIKYNLEFKQEETDIEIQNNFGPFQFDASSRGSNLDFSSDDSRKVKLNLQTAAEFPSMVLHELFPDINKQLTWIHTGSTVTYSCQVEINGNLYSGTGAGKRHAKYELAKSVLSAVYGIKVFRDFKSNIRKENVALTKKHPFTQVKQLDPNAVYEFNEVKTAGNDNSVWEVTLKLHGKEYKALDEEKDKAKCQVSKKHARITNIEYIEEQVSDEHGQMFVINVEVNGKSYTATASSKRKAKLTLAVNIFQDIHQIDPANWKLALEGTSCENEEDPRKMEIDVKEEKESPKLNMQKNSISLLNELHPGLEYSISEQLEGNRSTFTVYVEFGKSIFEGVGPTKNQQKLCCIKGS
eukprot:gene7068-7863_t